MNSDQKKNFNRSQHILRPLNSQEISTSTPKNDYPLIIQSSRKFFDPYFDSRQEIANQIKFDQQNEFNFYQIECIEKSKKKNPQSIMFNSTHNMTESGSIHGVKIYKQKNLNEFEQNVKKQLLKNNKNLGDIYLQLEQDFDGENKFNTSKNHETNLVEDLDVWAKKLGKDDKLQRILIEDEAKKIQATKTKKELKIKSDNILLLKRFVKNCRKSIMTDQVPSDLLQKFQNFEQKEFADQFKKSIDNVNKITNQRKAQNCDVVAETTVKKSLNNYKNNVIINEDKMCKLGDKDLDITPQGLENTLKQLIQISENSFEPQTTLQDKANQYKRQTRMLRDIIFKQQSHYENLQNSKVNTLRILRIQNSSSLNKIRYYQMKIAEVKETSEVLPANSPTKKRLRTQESQISFQESFMIKKCQENIRVEYQKSIGPIKKHMKDNSIQIAEIEIELLDIKDHLVQVEKSNRLLLFLILKLGKDFREYGLSWIIKQLWNMGENIKYEHLPSFLDDNSKEFILEKSRLEQDIQEINAMMNIQLDIYKQNLEPSDPPNSSAFSQIDILRHRVDTEKSQKSESQLLTNFQTNCQGIPKNDVSQINKNIEEVFKCKKTNNDIYYQQAQQLVRKYQKQEVRTIEPNLGLSYHHQLIGHTSSRHGQLSSSSRQQTSTSESQPISKIDLYNSSVLVNDCKSKYDVFILYTKLKNQIEDKQKDLIRMDQKELSRLIQKLQYKNYEKKYNVEGGIILGSLFGAFKAERDLIKNGLQKKYGAVNNN